MEKIFNFQLTLDNPIVKSHQVYGHFVLPGLAYIDMLYQLAKDGLKISSDDHCLKRLAIYKPLVVSKEKPVRLKITFERKQRNWKISVAGVETDIHKKSQAGMLYVTAELQKKVDSLEEFIDVEAVKQVSTKTYDMETTYSEARKAGLVHQGMIKAKGNVYITDSGCLIDVNANLANQDTAQNYLFHPALMDGAAMSSMILIREGMPDSIADLYLPLSYESFYSKGPLLDRCYVRIERSSIRTVNDITTVDMDFFDTGGHLTAKLSGLTIKRVKDPSQIDPERVKAEQVERDDNISSPVHEDGGNVRHASLPSVEEPLKKIFAKYVNTNMDQLENLGFLELGMESSQLLELVKDVEEQFELSLSPSLLFEYSNFIALAGYLEKKLAEDGTNSQNWSTESGTLTIPSDKYEFYGSEPFLQDHQVYARPAIMGVTYPCLAIETYLKNNPEGYPLALRNIRFYGGPVGLNKNETVEVEVKSKGVNGFETLFGTSNKERNCVGDFIGTVDSIPERLEIQSIVSQSKMFAPGTIEKIYKMIHDIKIEKTLKTIEALYAYDKVTLVAKITMAGSQKRGNSENLVFDPLLLNSCYLMADPVTVDPGIKVPLSIDSITVYRPTTEIAYVIKKIRVEKSDYISFDAIVVTETGEMIAKILNATLQKVGSSVQLKNLDPVLNGNIEKKKGPADIAIIGVSVRYPGASDINEFWNNLKEGKSNITEIPQERWNWREYFDKEKGKAGKMYSKWGGFLEDIDKFDHQFFNISPREAQIMDPQERLFLQETYSCIENAGYTPDTICDSRKIGVFVGVMNADYFKGSHPFVIANRVSYTYNFQGPSMVVNSASSSSLTAVHLALDSLHSGACDRAIAGGVNLILSPNHYTILSALGVLSATDRCSAFGAEADGFVTGEGVGAVLLKPLAQAINDGDNIYGIIKGSMINNGGRTNAFMAPNPVSQGQVIREAIERSGVNARSISYIEANGTGTPLGDPVEISGLTKAFQHHTDDKQFCAIGSVNSNIGHCECAIGIAALTKVLLQMKHGKIVPSLFAENLNPHIDFENTPFVVQRELTEWKSDAPRIAGVSSFGAGGSNAHVVVAEFVGKDDDSCNVSEGTPAIFVVSAQNAERLNERVKDLIEWLEGETFGDERLMQVAYTLQVGREAMKSRLGFTAKTNKEAIEKLTCYLNGENSNARIFFGQAKKNSKMPSVMSADGKEQEAVHKWMSSRNYEKLAALWVKGSIVDWNKLYEGKKPRRICLPSYPFAKESHWMVMP